MKNNLFGVEIEKKNPSVLCLRHRLKHHKGAKILSLGNFWANLM
jgi:hypothetical protein